HGCAPGRAARPRRRRGNSRGADPVAAPPGDRAERLRARPGPAVPGLPGARRHPLRAGRGLGAAARAPAADAGPDPEAGEMTGRLRLWIFVAGVAGLAAFVLWGLAGLPGFGRYPGPYGDIINRVAVAQTNATGVVSAVNFEYRGFDTLGEEFILFAAAAGIATVLRRLRGEHV